MSISRSLVYFNNSLVLFGGYTNESAPSDEMWVFDIGARRWSLCAAASPQKSGMRYTSSVSAVVIH